MTHKTDCLNRENLVYKLNEFFNKHRSRFIRKMIKKNTKI